MSIKEGLQSDNLAWVVSPTKGGYHVHLRTNSDSLYLATVDKDRVAEAFNFIRSIKRAKIERGNLKNE